jgi:single-stranded-DNA-specific exonuclease
VVKPLLNVEDSIQGRKWVLRCADEEAVDKLVLEGYSHTTAQLLAGRGVTPQTADSFMTPTLRGLMPDPSSLQDMDKAAAHIMDVVQAEKKITIFSDYDVDGGTSAAQLIRWGRAFGAQFNLYVPDRIKEGYGPSKQAFEYIKKSGADLVITLDCGAAAHDAIGTARDIDLDVIVIDHHMMQGPPPPAFAVVNPNRQDDRSGLGHLAAAGVSFMLLAALNREARRRGLENTPNLLSFLDLTALGTICDVVPLTGLNRAFVKQGLKVLSNMPNPGLEALCETAGIQGPYTPYHCGFILGPRINAGGRIGQANMGALLMSSDDAQERLGYAQELDRINEQRKVLQERILNEAIDAANALPPDRKLIIVSMSDWHAGIIGIVAGRLKDRFNRPAIVIGVDENGMGKGSGRSLHGVNLGAAILKAKEKGLLSAGGGHEMAAGLSIDPKLIDEFQLFMEEFLSDEIDQALQNQDYKVDAVLHAGAANMDLISEIDAVGPYGSGIPEPVFVFADMRITFAKRLKGGHVRCAFEGSDGTRLSGIAFRAEETGMAAILMASQPPRIHIAARVKENTWQGRTSVDIQLADIALA